MPNDKHPSPRQYKGVMVSSTFSDLENHRAAVIKSINGQDLKAVVMENDSAKPAGDVIDSSLQMVRDGSAYVGIISHKYGQIPECPKRNPDGLSLTELEFNEARRLDRPILLFIMGDDHDVKPADVEKDPEKIKKLHTFRSNAKHLRVDSPVNRIYKTFNNFHEFEVAAMQSVAELRRFFESDDKKTFTAPDTYPPKPDPIPRPPSFYAEPSYIGSHTFLGRQAQLDTLSDWAAPADSHPILLFEAIGGTGKSMLTWEWTINHATKVRTDWAGRFWYSFYEKGAIMADFCQRALAYITGQSLEYLRKKKTVELSYSQNRLGKAQRCLLLAYDYAVLCNNEEAIFSDQLEYFITLAQIGKMADAEDVWQNLNPRGGNWSRDRCPPGNAEYAYALFSFWKGELREELLAKAEKSANTGRNRQSLRNVHALRGEWHLEQCRWQAASDSLHEAVRMAREVGKTEAEAEAQLALAKFQLGQLLAHRQEAEHLANTKKPSHRALAQLWLAIDEHEEAKKHALAAYKWAWADGEPYVRRYELNKTCELLERLGTEIPNLPPYDWAKDEKIPWEDEVVAAIEKLRAEKPSK